MQPWQPKPPQNIANKKMSKDKILAHFVIKFYACAGPEIALPNVTTAPSPVLQLFTRVHANRPLCYSIDCAITFIIHLDEIFNPMNNINKAKAIRTVGINIAKENE